MYSDIDNIHAILLSREKTLPNISALMNTLMETDAKERVSKELLLEAMDDFETVGLFKLRQTSNDFDF